MVFSVETFTISRTKTYRVMKTPAGSIRDAEGTVNGYYTWIACSALRGSISEFPSMWAAIEELGNALV